MYYDLEKNINVKCNEKSKTLDFLYTNLFGRLILKIATKKFITVLYSKYMTSKLSKRKIKKFIIKNNIDMSLYENKNYKSFNDFFMRKIKINKRKINEGLISVCDSKLSVYEITDDLILNIKNSKYNISELTGINDKKYKFKYALIFRLCVDDYHHYVFPDDGFVVSKKIIKGKFHTVRPIAQKCTKVFSENTREVSILKCKNLGDVCYIEVGALMVGKIVNENVKTFKKGDEKGHFEFGGSTVIMLLNDKVKINKILIENTKNDIETIVKLGSKLGDL